MLRKWKRLDEPGVEVFELHSHANGFRAVSTIVHAGKEPFGLSYVWLLDHQWQSRRLDLTLVSPGERKMRIERVADGWLVDGRKDPALAGCQEIDLSATPFCNALAIRLLKAPGELTALYVSVPALHVTPSRQRYERHDGKWRYIDAGVARGFEADLTLDQDGLVSRYEGLFEAID